MSICVLRDAVKRSVGQTCFNPNLCLSTSLGLPSSETMVSKGSCSRVPQLVQPAVLFVWSCLLHCTPCSSKHCQQILPSGPSLFHFPVRDMKVKAHSHKLDRTFCSQRFLQVHSKMMLERPFTFCTHVFTLTETKNGIQGWVDRGSEVKMDAVWTYHLTECTGSCL